jgi:voltage-gated potassium channel
MTSRAGSPRSNRPRPLARSSTARKKPPPAEDKAKGGLRDLLRELYIGPSERAHRFRTVMLGVDLVVIGFVVVSSFHRGAAWAELLDPIFGVIILIDFLARLWIARRPLRELVHPLGIADMIVIASLLAPVVGEQFAFLRVLRVLRVLRSYRTIARLRRDVPFFRENQDLIIAIVNLVVFLLVMTALVFETQVDRNEAINNYADALYFTVTTLTTTGFGDITLEGTQGRLLAVLIMIIGVSLFLRLAQTAFRPQKVSYDCPECGLSRHDADAVHCKHCGETLNIPTEGLT